MEKSKVVILELSHIEKKNLIQKLKNVNNKIEIYIHRLQKFRIY